MMEWIKCSDRFPECGEEVLFIASAKDDYNYSGDKIHYQNQQFVGYLGNYSADDVSCVFGDGWVPFNKDELIAWMPLPKPPEE